MKKNPCVLFTFSTTADAMAMEQLCARRQLPGRLIPVPQSITADCGMAWRAPPDAGAALAAAAEDAGLTVAGQYEMVL